jgi:hypothetical protein
MMISDSSLISVYKHLATIEISARKLTTFDHLSYFIIGSFLFAITRIDDPYFRTDWSHISKILLKHEYCALGLSALGLGALGLGALGADSLKKL